MHRLQDEFERLETCEQRRAGQDVRDLADYYMDMLFVGSLCGVVGYWLGGWLI